MTNIDELIQAVAFWVECNSDEIQYLSSISGGYEIWVQCNLALLFRERNVTFQREKYIYFPYSYKADFDVRFGTDKYGIELKCQKKHEHIDFARLMQKDYAKITEKIGMGFFEYGRLVLGIYTNLRAIRYTPDYNLQMIRKNIGIIYKLSDWKHIP